MCDADPSLFKLNKKMAQSHVNRRLSAGCWRSSLIQTPHHGAHNFSRPLLHMGSTDYRNTGRYYQQVCICLYELPHLSLFLANIGEVCNGPILSLNDLLKNFSLLT